MGSQIKPDSPRLRRNQARIHHKVNLIVPLYKKEVVFARFLRHCESELTNVRLVVVVFDPDNSWRGGRSAEALNATSLETQTVIVNAQFSRSVALDRGAGVMRPQDLMLFVDVDVSVASGALDSVRRLVEPGVSVYFPIVFSQFGRDSANASSATGVSGYWRQHGYGMAAMFKSDYVGMDTTIVGWGKEDVALYTKFLTQTNLTVYRAPEPNLVHIYHPVTCDPQLSADQYRMCQASADNTFRSSVDSALALKKLGILDD